MAYEGYHLKFDGIIYPEKFCCNYKCTPDRRTDKGSGQNSQGLLKRKILPHKRSGVTWNTGVFTDKDLPVINTIVNSRDSVEAIFWKPNVLGYGTATCYLPDPTYEVLMVENNINYYRPIEFEIIEY